MFLLFLYLLNANERKSQTNMQISGGKINDFFPVCNSVTHLLWWCGDHSDGDIAYFRILKTGNRGITYLCHRGLRAVNHPSTLANRNVKINILREKKEKKNKQKMKRIFFSGVNFLCWLLFPYPFHPRITTVARKGFRSCCQKRRWQVTSKHACAWRMRLCMKRHGSWLRGVHITRRDGCSFMRH